MYYGFAPSTTQSTPDVRTIYTASGYTARAAGYSSETNTATSYAYGTVSSSSVGNNSYYYTSITAAGGTKSKVEVAMSSTNGGSDAAAYAGLNFVACGGSLHGQIYMVIHAYSSTKYTMTNNNTGGTYNRTFRDRSYLMAGTINRSNNNIYFSSGNCSSMSTYSVNNSGASVAYHYKPRIRVKY